MTFFESNSLRVEVRPGGIAFLRLDVPDRAVNVLNRQVFADLDHALAALTSDPSIRLLVARSDKASGFIAGADLQEFASVRGPEEARATSATGQETFNELAAVPFPTIAMVHGTCLGGGLEFALACDYRLVADQPKTQFGFPEIELGLLPGWGGTQRLPRVVGLERALQMILTGRRLNAKEARRWGLADALGATEPELADRLESLIKRALEKGKRPRHGLPKATLRQRLLESNPLGRMLLFRGTERILRRRVPDDMPAPFAALAAVRTGISRGMEAGLIAEREGATRLSSTPACRNLVNLFFQREEARKLPGKLFPNGTPPFQRIGIVGAGIMGAGIAQLAAIRGSQVVVHEVSDAALSAGIQKIESLFEKAVSNQVLTADAARQKIEAIGRTTSWEGFGDVDLVVEAVFEDVAIKRKVFAELERRTKPDAILATNTSSLLVEQIRQEMKRPERVAGLHFFNPVHKMPLVEVVRPASTPAPAVAALAQWVVDLGKTPVVVSDSPGFIVNRILMPYLHEAVVLAAEKLPVELIDKSMRRFGMPMGPFELLDQVGIDVATHVGRAVQPVFSDRLGGAAGMDGMRRTFEQMVQKGWLGQKSGTGFYRYQGKKKRSNPAIVPLLPSEDGTPGGNLMTGLPKAVQMREARERMVLLMVNEAAACLGEGLADDAEMIDLAMVMGTGWAPHRGGPLHYARDRGVAEIVKKLSELAQRHGPRFEPGPALRELAAKQPVGK